MGEGRGRTAEGSKATLLAPSYEYDAATLQLTKTTATDGSGEGYDVWGSLAKVTDAAGTGELP